MRGVTLRALSRLCRSQKLQVNIRFAASFKVHKICTFFVMRVVCCSFFCGMFLAGNGVSLKYSVVSCVFCLLVQRLHDLFVGIFWVVLRGLFNWDSQLFIYSFSFWMYVDYFSYIIPNSTRTRTTNS